MGVMRLGSGRAFVGISSGACVARRTQASSPAVRTTTADRYALSSYSRRIGIASTHHLRVKELWIAARAHIGADLCSSALISICDVLGQGVPAVLNLSEHRVQEVWFEEPQDANDPLQRFHYHHGAGPCERFLLHASHTNRPR